MWSPKKVSNPYNLHDTTTCNVYVGASINYIAQQVSMKIISLIFLCLLLVCCICLALSTIPTCGECSHCIGLCLKGSCEGYCVPPDVSPVAMYDWVHDNPLTGTEPVDYGSCKARKSRGGWVCKVSQDDCGPGFSGVGYNYPRCACQCIMKPR